MRQVFDSDRIKLITTPEDKTRLEVVSIMNGNDTDIRTIFYERYDRLDAAEFISKIELNDKETIGFLNLINENLDKTLFLDIAILKEFCNQSLAKRAIISLLDSDYSNKYLVADTSKENISANRCFSFFGEPFYETEDRVYYFLGGRTSYNDFINSKDYDKIKTRQKVKSLYDRR
ncbi:MAG: hypothetical protein Q4E39_01770 [bacterium]|nr:hypothetical protein [bacterium]